MLLTAISSIPIRNTTVDSTASGMYWSGLVRNSSTTSTTPAQVSDASWLRPPAPSTICVLVGLPLTTNVPDTPAAALARPRPTRSTSSLNRSPYLAANAREVAALWARITMKIENAVAASAGASVPQFTSGRPRLGRPPGTCPSTATPWLWKSNALLSTIEPTTATRPASATYWAEPVAAIPARPAARIAADAESAPTTRWRDEPNTANTASGSRIV